MTAPGQADYRSLREIPSFFIMAFRVVRGIPRRAAAARNSVKGARRLGPRDKITDRSMKFSSSRTFPGQGQLTKARIASDGILSMTRPILEAYFLVKWRARSGISSG